MTAASYTIDVPGPDPAPHAPGFKMPAGAWDTHFHVIDARQGFVAERSYTAPDATRESLLALHRALGIARGVFIQVSAHGTNNAAMLAALRATPDYRGVVVVDEQVSEAELGDLHRAGVRGVRVNVLFGGGVGFDHMTSLAAKVAARGWHMQLLVDVSADDTPWAAIEALPCDLVVDHMGHWDTGLGIDHPGFQRLLRLVGDGKAWVKLSGAERISRQSVPPFDDVVPIAQALIAAGPERCVWGSDWPHVKLSVAMPNTGDLLDLLPLWAPDEAQRKKILVDNPTRLYTGGD
jgi:predicted TIM-barrel fold metal-dependent hydrolase